MRWITPTTALLAAIGIAFAPPVGAQPFADDPFANLPAPEGRDVRGRALARVSFERLRDVVLPGPLPGGSLGVIGDSVEVPVAEGVAIVDPTGAEPIRIRPADATGGDPAGAWVEAADGRRRYRALATGRIEAQKRCRRCKAGWRTRWRLRIAGGTSARPVVLGDLLYFAAGDNRVYAVKARNGHRVWTSDIGDRVSSRLEPWVGELMGDDPVDTSRAVRLLLVVPDIGDRLIALSAEDGLKAAQVSLEPAQGRFVGSPASLVDGSVAVARQRYAATEASLLVYKLVEPEPPPAAPGEDPTVEITGRR